MSIIGTNTAGSFLASLSGKTFSGRVSPNEATSS